MLVLEDIMDKDNQQERHERIKAEIQKNPFISDEGLASVLEVSIHTIRSDRRKIGIPEVRKRGKAANYKLFAEPKPLSHSEVIGEILEIETDKEGMSILDATEDMTLQKTGIIRGHILFAQANTIANAIVDAEVALTAEAKVEYIAPAYAGDRILAKAKVISRDKRKRVVEVIMKAREELIFHATFSINCMTQQTAAHLRKMKDKKGK
jgi:acyl-coenzyme A thioesterase PaaI-like protein